MSRSSSAGIASAAAQGLLLWAVGMTVGALVFAVPALRATPAMPGVSSNPSITGPILVLWFFLARRFASRRVRHAADPLRLGRRLGLAFLAVNATLDLVVVAGVMGAGIEFYAYAGPWLAYGVLALVPWLTGRAVARRASARAAVAVAAVAVALLGALSAAASPVAAPAMVAVHDVAWSGDGRTLYFTAMRVRRDYSDYGEEKWKVYRYELATRRLTLFSPSSFGVAASPVDDRVIVGRRVGGNQDLYVLSGDGGLLARITTDPADDFGASFSPDGERVAFTSKRDGQAEVYVAGADGTGPRRLTRQAGEGSFGPSWSPDGGVLAYYRERGDGRDQIHVVRADGAGDVDVTKDAFNNVFPGWTPDGRVIYGQGVEADDAVRVFTMRRDGGDKRPHLGLVSQYARMAPDGTGTAYVSERAGGDAGVEIVDLGGRVLHSIAPRAIAALIEEGTAGGS